MSFVMCGEERGPDMLAWSQALDVVRASAAEIDGVLAALQHHQEPLYRSVHTFGSGSKDVGVASLVELLPGFSRDLAHLRGK